ncbi:hypothetical protein FE257_005081 [Aspergillus nanangensis]|uniref:Uncharacterized protein n=1 Tax=Aspergillus nanangensis TaxID=2582783 RepID=A0AAD4GVY8_ASPNN|nr:hypothetical protein FE257_005081 [Aspergillus nanangensis]
MKSILPHFLTVCAAALAITQQPLMAQENRLQVPVPGHNAAVYDAVPKEDQIFQIEYLEIAPTPIISDRLFFLYLRGDLPESKTKELGLPDGPLTDATLTVRSSAVYADGSLADEDSLTLPLKTMLLSDESHLAIRDKSGGQVEYMSSSDRSDFILDFQFPVLWMRSGLWTFKVEARGPPLITGWAQHEVVNYLIEGNDFYCGLYHYTGAWYETTKANADWTWTPISEAKQTQDGYTYKWVVPLGGTDAVAKEYVTQGQGYAPINNVFKGSLRRYASI